MSTGFAAALAAVVVSAALAGLYAFARNAGYEAGSSAVQTAWDADTLAATARRTVYREEGYALAAEYRQQVVQLEKQNATARVQLRRVLNQPAACPASGLAADIVIPADVIGSMFNLAGANADGPRPATTRAD